ncbi:MAG: sulfatase-like hydrolase/transferase [Kiritimatiellae bacterium]|nr:sulfatase-like hydrolase/transferase [Kiritimatiellia bacterium]
MKKPNVLIFMADHLIGDVTRKDHPCITPNLDRFGAEGVRFESTFCTAPHCCPSRASFQTGEYPSTHGVWNNVSNRCAISQKLNAGIRTLGQYLKEAGYTMGYSGKWHVSEWEWPADFGWREFHVRKHQRPPEIDSRIAAYDAQAREKKAPPATDGTIQRPGWGNLQYYGTRESEPDPVNPEITHGIEGLKTLAAEGEPWAMMISTNVPHDPHVAPDVYVELYENSAVNLPASWLDDLRDKPRICQRMRNQYWDQMSEAQSAECLKRFWAKCTMVDAWFGKILAALEQTGQADDTLVIFTSDHGDYAGAHGLWAKGIPCYREAYAIPGIVRWKNGIRNPGRVVKDLVSICDFMPTIVEAATGAAPAVFGRSLLPYLRDEQDVPWRDALFTQCNGVELYYTQRSVFTRDWKLVYNGFDFDELYDLRNDPGETVNLAFPDRYPQRGRAPGEEFVPWPRLTPELEAVRRELYAKLWAFARANEDHFLYTPYITTSQAAYGPLLGVEGP